MSPRAAFRAISTPNLDGHRVEILQAWAAHSAARVEFFDAFATDIVDYMPTDGGSTVAVSANVHDMDGMVAALQTPEATALEESRLRPWPSLVR